MITRYTAGRKIVLIGAGVAIGVSTYLVALKIRRNQLATSAKAAAKAAATAAGAEDAKSVSMRSAGVKNGFPPKAGAISDESKQACEGCDCGLMEPGPIEGTMHAYERHVIICRFVSSTREISLRIFGAEIQYQMALLQQTAVEKKLYH